MLTPVLATPSQVQNLRVMVLAMHLQNRLEPQLGAWAGLTVNVMAHELYFERERVLRARVEVE